MITDANGKQYYTAEEAMEILGVKRSKFQKLTSSMDKFRPEEGHRKYYSVESIDALKQRPLKLKREPGAQVTTSEEVSDGN